MSKCTMCKNYTDCYEVDDDLCDFKFSEKALAKHDAKIRAEVIEELKPFFDELKPFFDECGEFDWICDDLCGEFINPDTGESWCAEHCYNGTRYECIKKWCELNQMKEQKE